MLAGILKRAQYFCPWLWTFMDVFAEFRKTVWRLYQVKEHLLPSDSVLYQLMPLLTSMLLF